MNFLKKTKIVSIALLSMVTLTSAAQDRIASQAPSDRTMRDIKNVKLTKSITADLADPASDIYTNWTNDLWKVEGHVAANYKIDLRGFHMPTTSRVVTSNFGPRWGRRHQGLDIKVYVGDTIRSAFDGKVRVVACEGLRKGYGYYIVIRHPNGLETLYGHLSKQLVKENQVVRAGEVIGLGGNTGRSTGSHLHFETRLLGEAINPVFMFDFPNQDVTGNFYIARTGAITRGKLDNQSIDMMEASASEREGSLLVSVGGEEAVEAANATAEKIEASESAKAAGKSRSQKNSRTSATYKVKSGDTLSSIAKRNGTTVKKLCKLNGITERTILSLGKVLRTS